MSSHVSYFLSGLNNIPLTVPTIVHLSSTEEHRSRVQVLAFTKQVLCHPCVGFDGFNFELI